MSTMELAFRAVNSSMPNWFANPGTWDGGFYELALELGPRSDERLQAALDAVWSDPTLEGCYRKRDFEPFQQTRVPPTPVLGPEHLFGIATLPNSGRIACGTVVVRDQDGPDWLVFYVPLGALCRSYPVGGFPFDDRDSRDWRIPMDAWLRGIGSRVFEDIPFSLGLIGHEVSGYACSAEARRQGIPQKRWFGYLWPSNLGLQWFPPNEWRDWSLH
jgi:hypothetical protein